MFNNKRRIHSAWARGMMFGKAAGARDERDRIIKLLKDAYIGGYCFESVALVALIKGEQK